MKKILLFSLALSAMLFTSCEKEDDNGGSSSEGYTLTITPTTVAIGETVTLAITGDGAEDLSWYACFEGPVSSCLSTPITGGELEYTVTLSAGEYTFHATSGDHETNNAQLTIVE